jgi:small nuclear ribonucleoprotein (snRNP)-like protein|tara:strand:- start:42 stop:161 length:120 start_codon:yes stop_codon:yes gene_type:complete
MKKLLLDQEVTVKKKDNSIWIGILIAFVIALGALLRSNG